jgi:hypothetical protein
VAGADDRVGVKGETCDGVQALEGERLATGCGFSALAFLGFALLAVRLLRHQRPRAALMKAGEGATCLTKPCQLPDVVRE